MTRPELIEIENDLGRALTSLDSGRPYEALAYARSAHAMLGEMLSPHEAGATGIVVEDIEPPPWDHARNLEYIRKLRMGEPTTEAEWDKSYKWTRSLLNHDPIAVVDATVTALTRLGKAKP